ncbi:MAG: DNA repair exonuclease [Deltaproteobacteria bacterium]|nr:MAG: DNA repair exonuclease [Deltaproteobacteria bacterium]
MPIKIFHTADVHLGMKFTRGYDPAVQERLIEARFQTLRSMVGMANEQTCDLFVVAGDLFNGLSLPRKDILRAADILKGFEGKAVLVLPGNHDYVSSEEENLWTKFRDAMSEHTLLLREPRPYLDLKPDLGAIFYPAPCRAKHSKTNGIGWIREYPKDPDAKFHIGIAHGSLEGLSPDFSADYYPMSPEELRAAGIGLWLMGHTHIRYPDVESGTEARILFPSTPEPDGFDCSHPGYAWLIHFHEEGSVLYQSLRTGRFQFFVKEEKIGSEDDMSALKSYFSRLDRQEHLVKLKLRGRAPGRIHDELSLLLQEWKDCVLHLEVDLSEMLREITPDDIDREFTEGSFPHRLLRKLAREQENPNSLQMAYQLIREVKA